MRSIDAQSYGLVRQTVASVSLNSDAVADMASGLIAFGSLLIAPAY